MATGDKSLMGKMAGIFKHRKFPYMFGLLGCGFLDSGISVATALMIKFILDAIAEKSMSAITEVCIQFAAVMIVLCTVKPLFQYWFGRTVKKIMTDLRSQLFLHMTKLPISYYENSHSGDSISRMTNDLGVMERALSGNVRSVISLIVSGAGSAVIMFFLDWRFAIAMLVMGILSAYVNARFAKPLRMNSLAIQKNAGIQSERLSDLIAGTQVNKIYQMSDSILRKYWESNRELTKLSIARTKKSAYLNSTNYLLLWINNGGAFTLGTFMLINGQITIGNLLSIILLLENVTNLFRNLGGFWANLQFSLAGADRVFELLDAAEEPERYIAPSKENADVGATCMIEFRGGSFAYGNQDRVLDGLNCKAEKGQLVALVGPSGGGKSTVMKLLLGFYPLEQGEIRIEGKRFSDHTLAEWREKMAYVSQDTYLFEGTIADNIRYGRVNATMEEVVAAAQAAFAHDFIIAQADGYNTKVGERGTRLSGGQKQRIAIARALLKNAPILLLDEATSALDSESEQAVRQGLERLMKGKTTVAIAHRLSTIQQADVIYVIDKGKIAEQGTHDELLKTGSVYTRLLQSQERNRDDKALYL